MIHVARLAGADEFIAKMPHGYDTIIEERGSNLSGGQRQRIAIAPCPRHQSADPESSTRRLLRSTMKASASSRNNMKHIVRNRTVIIIAHRLAAVRICNRIIGMADGRIVEQARMTNCWRVRMGFMRGSGPCKTTERSMSVLFAPYKTRLGDPLRGGM